MNRLYFGDCLDILKLLARESRVGLIDCIYIDPPFNSNRNYNVLFEDVATKDAKAQKQAFADTWSNVSYLDTLNEIKNNDLDIYNFLSALDNIRVPKSAVSYLTTMAIRIYYMHTILSETGSFYLHCDPVMSHYLKLLCDLIFGNQNFHSEIIWRRTNSHNKLTGQYGPIHDVILFYSKTSTYKFHPGTRPYSKEYITSRFVHSDSRGIYQMNYLTGPGVRNGESGTEWRDFNPTANGRHWAIPKSLLQFLSHNYESLGTIEKLDALLKQELIVFPKKSGGQPMYKQYIGSGVFYQDIWAYQPNTTGVLYQSQECIDEDVKYLENEDEILGYPTQKPIGILKRILETSTDEGDLVADFFCGCGTTIAAAQELKRKWIGADISHLATRLITKRLVDTYGIGIRKSFEAFGFPRDIASARELSEKTESGRLKFQDWVIEVLLGGVSNPKKTADGGWDGHITFVTPQKKEVVLIEVKSGNVNVKNLREFIQVVNKQNAAIGLFVCFAETVTKPMLHDAKECGYFGLFKNCDKIQVVTIEDLLNGKLPNIPESRISQFRTAEQVPLYGDSTKQGSLFDKTE